MKKMLRIKEPYWTAGRKFGWPGKTAGLGIKESLLQGDGILELKVGDSEDIYRIEKSEARALVTKYNAHHKVGLTWLSVVPWSAFTREPGPQKREEKVAEKVKETPKEKQTKLF